MLSDTRWKAKWDATKLVPPGYAIVRDGKVLPDDLTWSVFEKKWRRADDPEYLTSSVGVDVELLVCVVRKPKTEAVPGQVRRNYKLR